MSGLTVAPASGLSTAQVSALQRQREDYESTMRWEALKDAQRANEGRTDSSTYRNARPFQGKSKEAKALTSLVTGTLGDNYNVKLDGGMLYVAPKSSSGYFGDNIGNIREDLGIKPGVISENNSWQIARKEDIIEDGRRVTREYLTDASKLESGHFMQVPISALGQEVNNGFLGFFSNKKEMQAFQDAAAAYLKR